MSIWLKIYNMNISEKFLLLSEKDRYFFSMKRLVMEELNINEKFLFVEDFIDTNNSVNNLYNAFSNPRKKISETIVECISNNSKIIIHNVIKNSILCTSYICKYKLLPSTSTRFLMNLFSDEPILFSSYDIQNIILYNIRKRRGA